MVYQAFDLIASLFYSTFGSPVLVGLVFVALIMFMVLAMKGNIAVALLVLIPVIVGLVINSATTNFVQLPPFLIPIVFLIAGMIFSLFFLFYLR